MYDVRGVEGEEGSDDGEEDEAEVADAAIDGHHDVCHAVGATS